MIAHFDETRHVLVGQSPRTRQVLRLIDKLGKCRWPALLLGETGTGKEVVARAIHSLTAAKERCLRRCVESVGLTCAEVKYQAFVLFDCSLD